MVGRIFGGLGLHPLHDTAQASGLLRECKGTLASLTADGAYNRDPVYQAAAARQPKPPPDVVIPPRANAALSTTDPDQRTSRDRHIRLVANYGRTSWQRAIGCVKRNHAETTMGR